MNFEVSLILFCAMPETRTSHVLKVFFVAPGMYAWIRGIHESDRNLMLRLRSTANIAATDWRRGNCKSRRAKNIQSKLTDS